MKNSNAFYWAKDDSDYSIWSTSVTESFDTKRTLSTGYFSYLFQRVWTSFILWRSAKKNVQTVFRRDWWSEGLSFIQVILSFTVVPWVITQRFLPLTEQRSISITLWVNREDQLQTRKVKITLRGNVDLAYTLLIIRSVYFPYENLASISAPSLRGDCVWYLRTPSWTLIFSTHILH